MDAQTAELALGHLVLLVTTLVGLAYQVYRENRNHRWMLEERKDREQARDHIIERIDAKPPAWAPIRRADVIDLLAQRHDDLTAARLMGAGDRRHAALTAGATIERDDQGQGH